jgi:hypothetical protein
MLSEGIAIDAMVVPPSMAYRQADEQEIGQHFDWPQSTTEVDVLGKSTLKVIRTPSPPALPSQSSGSEGPWDYEPLPWPSDLSLFKHKG